VIDLSLSSGEENFIADTSRDVEFTRKLFGDLNRDILGPPGDGKVIILDDSDEEKEAPDQKTVGTELMATYDAPEGAKNDNSCHAEDQGAEASMSQGRPWFCIAIFPSPLCRGVGMVM
jgi:hypothetical protein